MKKVLIIGANLAGLNCALNLNLRKFSVTVVDKSRNPGKKVCAGGVSSKADPYIPKKFYEKSFDRMIVHYKDKSITIHRKHRPLHTYDREAYIKHLIKLCKKKGIKVDLGKEVKSSNIRPDRVIIGKEPYEYDFVIGADGAESAVRKSIMLPCEYINTIEAKTKKKFKSLHMIADSKFKGGYFWIFPHKGYSSIGCGGDIKHFKSFCERNKIKYYDPKGARIQYRFAGYKFGRRYLIGEAAGYASALTGEGVYYSIISGIELAKELNTGISSKRLVSLAGELRKHQIVKGRTVNVILAILTSTAAGRKLFEKICEKLSVK